MTKRMEFKTRENYRKWEHKFFMNQHIKEYFGGFDNNKGVFYLVWTV